MKLLVYMGVFFLALGLEAQTILVNAGGPAFTDALGRVWSADTGSSGGTTFTSVTGIADTADDTLYHTGRQATSSFGYSFTVTSGIYRVKLQWAEIQGNLANNRQFRVTAEGRTLFDPFDVRQRAGADATAYILDRLVFVLDTQLDINFNRLSGDPFVQALDIQYVSPVTRGTSTPAECAISDFFFDEDATAGANLFCCTAADTWTQCGGVIQPATDTTTCFQVLDTDGGTPVFNVDCTNERVGIGTADPLSSLEVASPDLSQIIVSGGSSSQFPVIQLRDEETGGLNWNIENGREGDGILGFFLTASTRVVFDANGQVGIGATSPDELLHVQEAVDGTTTLLLLENSQAHAAASLNETAELHFGFGGNNDVAGIIAGKENDYDGAGEDDSYLAFETDRDGTATEAMRLPSTGGIDVTTGTVTFADSANVASATTMTLPTGNLHHVTGTTDITTLNTCDAANSGRLETLIFDGILTFTDGNNLILAGNFVTTANDVIQLICDGTNWYESSRSVN